MADGVESAPAPTEYLCRFDVKLGGVHAWILTRRAISSLPAEGTIGFLDDGDERGWSRRPYAATFRNGAWKIQGSHRAGFEPRFWSVIDPVEREAR